jgi:hypothetical protein
VKGRAGLGRSQCSQPTAGAAAPGALQLAAPLVTQSQETTCESRGRITSTDAGRDHEMPGSAAAPQGTASISSSSSSSSPRPASGPLLHSLLQQKQEQQTRTQPEQPGRPVLLLTAPVPAHPRPFARPPRRQAGLRALLPMVASAADPLRVMPRPQRSALARPLSPASWAADLRVRAPASRPPRSGPLRRQAGQAARLTRARASALRATCRPRAGRREPVQMSWSKRPCQLGPRRPPNRWRTRADDWTATWAGPTGPDGIAREA